MHRITFEAPAMLQSHPQASTQKTLAFSLGTKFWLRKFSCFFLGIQLPESTGGLMGVVVPVANLSRLFLLCSL